MRKTIAYVLAILMMATPLFAQLSQSGGSGGGSGGAVNITQIAGVAVSVAAAGIMKVGLTDGSGNAITSTAGNLNVQCANCSGSGVSAVDEAAMTEGTSVFAPAGGYFKTVITALTSGQQGMVALTASRSFHTALYDASGTAITNTGAALDVNLKTSSITLGVTANAGTNLNTSLLALEAGGNLAALNTNAGAQADAAVTTDINATLSSKLRGLVKILGNVWDSGNSRLNVFIQNATLAVTQSTSPWVDNVSQFGGSAVVTGVGPSGSGIPRVTDSRDDMVGSVSISANTVCPAASTVPTSSAGCLVVPVIGYQGVAGVIQAGTLVATAATEASYDGGTTWSSAVVETSTNTQAVFFIFTNPNAETPFHFIIGSNVSHVRIRVAGGGFASYTSGAATAVIRSSTISSVFTVGALPVAQIGQAPSLFAGQVGFLALTATPTAKVAGTIVQQMGDVYGAAYIRQDHPNRFGCVMDSSATTSTVITGCTGAIATTAAPGAGLAIYITDIEFYASTVSSTTNRNVIQTGTGGTCGTGTALLYAGYNPAAFQGNEVSFNTPRKGTVNGEVCFLNGVTGQKLITVSGYVVP